MLRFIPLDAVLLVALLAGVMLAAIGLRGRRVGADPHCRRCGYNLTGVELESAAARCAECGVAVATPGAVRTGLRVRHYRLATAGAALFVLGAMSLSGTFAAVFYRIDLYRLKPVDMMLGDLEYPTWPAFSRGIREIRDRYLRRELTPQQLRRAAEILLADQARPKEVPGVSRPLASLLGKLFDDGTLTPEQRRRALENAVTCDPLRFRAQVVRGWDFPVLATYRGRLPSARVHPSVEAGELRATDLNGVDGGSPFVIESSVQEPGSTGAYVRIESPGKYRLEQELRVRITAAQDGLSPGEPRVLFERLATLAGDVQVFDQPPPELLRARRDPGIDAQMPEHVRIVAAECRPHPERRDAQRVELRVAVEEELPIAIAFEVLAGVGPQSSRLGFVTSAARPRFGRTVSVVGAVPGDGVERLTIRLSGSARAAHRTTELSEFWDGELEFADVPVGTGPAALRERAGRSLADIAPRLVPRP